MLIQHLLQCTKRAQCHSLVNSLRAKGTLISEPDFYPLRDAIFPTRERENGLFKEKPSTKAVFPFLAWVKSHLARVENRGSPISVAMPAALSIVLSLFFALPLKFAKFFTFLDYSLKPLQQDP